MADFNLSSQNINLSDLQNRMSVSKSVKQTLTYDEVYKMVSRAMEEDAVAKLKEQSLSSAVKAVKDKQYYRENFAFYFNLVKNQLLTNGIRVAKQGEDGRAVEIPIDELAKDITSGFVGYDCLEDAFNDPGVSDIFVIAWNDIWVERNGKNEVYPKHFRNPVAYKNFVDRLLRESGKQLDTGENKIVDFEVYGNRGNVLIDSIATKGICLTMRKHNEVPIQLDSMIKRNLMTQEIADMLGMFIEGETNIIYAGITGSGKTTTLRALLDNYVPKLNKRILVLEDTQELFLKNPHTVDLTTIVTDDPKTSISLRDLNISALRMKPKYIVVGEVRGAEAESAVEGMETGHSTIFSMHGGNVWNVINRLVTKYLMQMPSLSMEVVERIIGSAVNFVCIQDDVPHIGRRLTSVHQISYDFKGKVVVAKPIIRYNFETNDWDWLNPISDDIINVMTRRGVSIDRAKKLNADIMSRIKPTDNPQDERG